jgi:hypothetical protein
MADDYAASLLQTPGSDAGDHGKAVPSRNAKKFREEEDYARAKLSDQKFDISEFSTSATRDTLHKSTLGRKLRPKT